MKTENTRSLDADTSQVESNVVRQSTPNAAVIQGWLVSKFAELMKIQPEQIDVKEPLQSYGLDSVTAVDLVGEIEDRLGRKLPATLAYKYPTIEDLANHLAEEVHG